MIIKSIELANMNFCYDEGEMENLVFRNLSYCFPMEKTICFSGATGSGKNSLMKILAGLEDPISGALLVNGENIFDKQEADRFEYRKAIGYGFSQGGLLQNRTIRQNLELAMDIREDLDEQSAAEQIDEYMEIFELSEVQTQRPAIVSGGMRMAACLARAFVHDPQLLLLNHPTNGLTPRMQKNLVELIKHHQDQKRLRHIFMVSENEDFLAQLNPITLEVHADHLRCL
jgi:ABC-type multidrug transport system ATPase subunit